MDKFLPALYAVLIAAFVVGAGDVVTYSRDSFLQIAALRTSGSSQDIASYGLMPFMSLLIANPPVYVAGIIIAPVVIIVRRFWLKSESNRYSLLVWLLTASKISLKWDSTGLDERRKLEKDICRAAIRIAVLSVCIAVYLFYKKQFLWILLAGLFLLLLVGLLRILKRQQLITGIDNALKEVNRRKLLGKASFKLGWLTKHGIAWSYLWLSLTLSLFTTEVVRRLGSCLLCLTHHDGASYFALKSLTSTNSRLISLYGLFLLLTFLAFSLLYQQVAGIEKGLLILSLSLHGLLNLYALAFYSGFQLAEYPLARVALPENSAFPTGRQEVYLLGTNANTYAFLLVKGQLGKSSKRSGLLVQKSNFQMEISSWLPNIFQSIASEKPQS